MKRILLLTIALLGLSAYTFGQSLVFKQRIQFTEVITEIDEGDTIVFAASSDDAEQENDEVDTPYDDDIDAGWEGEPEDQNILTAGMRFRDILIPEDATIDSAFIHVWSHEGKADYNVANIRIFAEASDFAETYDEDNFNEDNLITDRPRSADSVYWVVNEEWVIWEPYRTPDLKALVQEVTDRPGWETGNPLAFMFIGEDQGLTDTLENAREWEAFENIADPDDSAPDGTPGDGQNHPERVPELVIYYTASQGVFTAPIVKTDVVTEIDEGDTIVFNASSDDAEQENEEVDTPWDDDIDAGWEGEPEDQNTLSAGMRFQNVTIPKGAKIDSAHITVHSHEGKAAYNVANIRIFAEASDNAPTYDEENFNADYLITDRPRTTDSVYWIVDEEWVIWEAYNTPDLSSLVQEVIDRPGWESGNPLAFMFIGEDQGLTDTLENAREWEAFENIADPDDSAPDGTPGDGQNHPERVPRLTVYFSLVTSVEEAAEAVADRFRIYPNPTGGELNLVFDGQEATRVHIYSISGQLIMTCAAYSDRLTFDLSHLSDGVYLIQTVRESGTHTQKFMIK